MGLKQGWVETGNILWLVLVNRCRIPDENSVAGHAIKCETLVHDSDFRGFNRRFSIMTPRAEVLGLAALWSIGVYTGATG